MQVFSNWIPKQKWTFCSQWFIALDYINIQIIFIKNNQ